MTTGRYSGYDEYEGIFGALGSGQRTTNRGPARSLASRFGRSTSSPSDAAFGLNVRAFPSARRASRRGLGSSALSTNGYERRERYLSERASKRGLKTVDGDGLDDPDEMLDGTAEPRNQQIWLPTKNFSFRQRAGKLDTRTIARLDLHKIVATTDVETIQRHLENLAFSDVTLEDVQQYSDSYFLKLFQIAQLTVEYLLNVQDSLASHCENLETQCVGLAEECQSLESENQKVEGEILALKKEIRQKQSTLATFEVMLLNASAAKRAAQSSRTMNQQNLDQENDPAVLNILGSSVPPTDAEESGAVPLVSECVLCGKKFISPEYLVRHQQKKHSDAAQSRKKSRKPKKLDSDASGSDESSRSASDSRKRREPRTAPLPAEVIQALNDRNEMTKQLMELQFQLRTEKEKRAEEARQAEQQQAQLASQLTAYMTKLQDTLIDMEKKQEQSKHEMMRYTQDALERAKNERVVEQAKRVSHAGRIESDDDDGGTKDRKKPVTTPEEIEKRILDSLLRAQAEIHQKNSELEQANRKLQTKLRRKARQMQFEPPPTTLMSMTTMDAQRFGIDRGFDIEDTPRANPKPIAVADKPVQTDEEKDDLRKRRAETVSQQVQTDNAPLETTVKPEVKPISRQPPPRAESKISATPVPVVETPKPALKPSPLPEIKPAEEVKPPPPVAPKKADAIIAEEKKPDSKFQHAAHIVGKVARGFLTRRTLQNPSNWLITLPSLSLAHALTNKELNQITQAHGGELHDVTIEVEDDMTANDLRVAFAEALTEKDGLDNPGTGDFTIDYHRILLHHRRTRQEINGNQFIYHLRNQLEVEIVPSFEEAEAHVDEVVGFHEQVSIQVRDVRRASMELTPGEVPLALRVHQRDDADELANRAAIRVQSIVRRFLATRTVQLMKIDRLVEARLVAMRSLTSSPRSHTMSARSQRQLTRSASVAVIRNETEDEQVVNRKAQQIHTRLADLVKQKTGIDTRTKSAKWSRGQLSTEEYERHMEEIEQNRKTLSPEVQQRISEISERVDKLAEDTYDPVVAKQNEEKYIAASRIQLAVQVAMARKKLKQLLGQNEERASPNDSQATIEQDKQSLPFREEDASDEELEGKRDADNEEKKAHVSSDHDADTTQLAVEEFEDVDVKRLADAYEQAAEEKASPPPRAPTPQPEPKPAILEAKPRSEMAPRPGTPPPSREDLLGRSPRPHDESRVISPFSKTPLMSRRAAVTRRGSGYDNAR